MRLFALSGQNFDQAADSGQGSHNSVAHRCPALDPQPPGLVCTALLEVMTEGPDVP